VVAGASSVFRAGVAWVVVLMAVRAAAAPNRPAIFLSMIAPRHVKRHVPLPTEPANQPKPVMFCSPRHFPPAGQELFFYQFILSCNAVLKRF
jgi:hypothetical protein